MKIKYQIETTKLKKWFQNLHEYLSSKHIAVKPFVTETLGLTTPIYYQLLNGKGSHEATKIWAIHAILETQKIDIGLPPIPHPDTLVNTEIK